MAQTEYRVAVSARAAHMLVEHAAFLARVSPAAAERLTAAFETAANSLAYTPQRCPWLIGEELPRNAYRTLLFEKRYLLLFTVHGDLVQVEYMIDTRQDYRWLP